jgi:hypothetical protein
MSPNSVSALAYRAREGLRQAFLQMHTADLVDADCGWTHDHLGAFVRGGLSRRDSDKVEDHLEGCRRCTAIYLELTEVNSSLAAILGPIVLGGAAAAYLGGTSGGAGAVAGLGLVFGRVKDVVASNGPAMAAAGAAAGLAGVAVAGFLILNHTPDGQVATDAARPGLAVDASPSGGGGHAGKVGTSQRRVTTSAPLRPATPSSSPHAVRQTATGTAPSSSSSSSSSSATGSTRTGNGGTTQVLPPRGTGQPSSPGTGGNPGGTGSTPTPHPNPTPKPTPKPTPTPKPPPAPKTADVAVSGAVTRTTGHGNQHTGVSVRVSGVPAGATSTVTLTFTRRVKHWSLPSGCHVTGPMSASCQVGPGGSISTSVDLAGALGLALHASPVAGYADPSLANNSLSLSARPGGGNGHSGHGKGKAH